MVAIRVRRSVTVAWFLTLAAAGVLGLWPADVVFSLVWWTWVLVTTVWLLLRPRRSPVVRDPTPWGLHRLGVGLRRTRGQ